MNKYFLPLFISLLFSFTSHAEELKDLECPSRTDLPPPFFSQTKLKTPKGSIILLPGLNFKPEKMDELANLLNQTGYDTYRLSLTGNFQGSPEASSQANWFSQIKDSWCRAKANNSSKIILAGLSMGGSLAVNFVDKNPNFKIDKLLLFAPAIEIKFYANFLYGITWLRFFDVSLPSFTPEAYRAKKFTSLKTYETLLELETDSQNLINSEALSNTPTLIFLNPNDSLVSYSDTLSWIKAKKLIDWRLSTINSKPKISGLKDHIFTDEQSAGTEAWMKIKNEIRKFIK
ncbi:MAG: alpha/beta hydrolase [Bdellovibrionota bacterium]